MQSNPSPEDLKGQLDRLAASGARRLRRWVLRCAVDRYLRWLFPFALCVCGAILAAVLLDRIAGLSLWPFGLAMTIVTALALPAVALAACVLFEFARHRIDRRMSLALYDRQLGLKDRLQAADEYLEKPDRSDFEQAAVEDARGHAQTALGRSLAPVRIRPPELIPPHRRLGALAAVLLAAALWLGQYSAVEAALEETVTAAIPGDFRDDTLVEQLRPDSKQPRPASMASRREGQAEIPQASGEAQAVAFPTREFAAERRSSDRSAAGSEARRSNEARQAQSGASGQRADKQEQDQSAAEKQKPRPRKEQPEPPPPDESKDSAGLQGGKGTASGGRMASSDHPSAQDKTRQPEPEGQADEGNDEEDEEQKAGSASRPLINQRKAPVNRSLSPSADGGEERDDLNGRGGPGGLKKTRGVAAMLLGVPLPDYLQGKVNPGRMKVQSEQGRAEEHQADPAQAEQRLARDTGVGHTAHREIPPWGRETVRDYFLAQRTNGDQAPEEEE